MTPKKMPSRYTLVSLLFLSHFANSTTYFFSSSGDDTRSVLQATISTTPWKTTSKLNSFFSNLQPGDSVLFKKGDVFYGSIIIQKSGSSTFPIVLGTYGAGAKPIITGLSNLSGWINNGINIWESGACADCGIKVNILLINGLSTPMGRYPNLDAPNKGFLTYESHFGNTSITDKQLTASPHWTGAELIVRKERWTFDRTRIINHSGSTLTYKAQTDYLPTDDYGYFIQNDIRTLDQQGEWYYNPITKKVTIYSTTPPPFDIQASSVNNLLYVHDQSDITIENLIFKGSVLNLIDLAGVKNLNVTNCDLYFAGIDAIYGRSLTNFSIQNSNIDHSNNNGIFLEYNCTSSIIKNNSIQNTGLYMGMGDAIHYFTFGGIVTGGQGTNSSPNTLIELNTVNYTGYNGISFIGSNTIIRNNLVSNFCITKDDGGGIYTFKGPSDSYDYTGIEINENIVVDGKSACQGSANPTVLATWGIYLDDNAQNIKLIGNTVAGIPNSGIFLHNAKDIIITKNTLYNNGQQLFFQHNKNYNKIKNVIVTNNILASASPSQLMVKFMSQDDDLSSFCIADSNYYSVPDSNINLFFTYSFDEVGTYKTFKEWKSTLNIDKHSSLVGQCYWFGYNASNKRKTIILNNTYIGVDNTKYKDTITLPPFSSAILLKTLL